MSAGSSNSGALTALYLLVVCAVLGISFVSVCLAGLFFGPIGSGVMVVALAVGGYYLFNRIFGG